MWFEEIWWKQRCSPEQVPQVFHGQPGLDPTVAPH